MLWSVLSLEAKMIVIISCAIVIFVSILIIICLIIPDTWWNCPWSGDRLPDARDGSDISLKDFHHHADELPTGSSNSLTNLLKPRLSRSELCYDCSGYSLDSGRPGSLCRESSSNASSVVSDNGMSPCSSTSGSMTALQSVVDETSRPQLHVTLQSTILQSEDNVDQLLIVTIENATDLPARSYVDTVDPSVIVRLERRNSSRFGTLMGALIGSNSGSGARGRRNSNHPILVEDSTCPVVYHSRHPRYHHSVTLAVPKSTQLKDCQLVLKVEDKDKLVGVTDLGQCRIDLRELDLLSGWLEGSEKESIVRLSRFLDATKPSEKGAVFLGLSFLPTSQRITVQITQCNRLAKTAGINEAVAAAALPIKAVVRLFLLNESGRVLKKRKTAPFDHPNAGGGGGGGRIELNEIFHLDVEIERWDRCVILIVLSRIYEPQRPQQTTPSSLDGQPCPRSPPIYHHSGHVALGKRVAGHAERIHWNSAFQSPRRVISQWHSLH